MGAFNLLKIHAMVFAMCAIVSASFLSAQETSDPPNVSASAVSGRSVGEFLTPEGRFDLEAARKAGFQGSIDIKGFQPRIDEKTGQPVFRQVSASTAGNPDDSYWDNSLSSSIPGVNGDVFALVVYDGKLIVEDISNWREQ